MKSRCKSCNPPNNPFPCSLLLILPSALLPISQIQNLTLHVPLGYTGLPDSLFQAPVHAQNLDYGCAICFTVLHWFFLFWTIFWLKLIILSFKEKLVDLYTYIYMFYVYVSYIYIWYIYIYHLDWSWHCKMMGLSCYKINLFLSITQLKTKRPHEPIFWVWLTDCW